MTTCIAGEPWDRRHISRMLYHGANCCQRLTSYSVPSGRRLVPVTTRHVRPVSVSTRKVCRATRPDVKIQKRGRLERGGGALWYPYLVADDGRRPRVRAKDNCRPWAGARDAPPGGAEVLAAGALRNAFVERSGHRAGVRPGGVRPRHRPRGTPGDPLDSARPHGLRGQDYKSVYPKDILHPMSDQLDLRRTYRAILDAARDKRFISYGDLAKANGTD